MSYDEHQAMWPKMIAELAAKPEPDMRHPKIQALIGSRARREIELSIAEDLLNDPAHEISGMDGEYWLPIHDKIVALQQAAELAARQEPVAWMMTPNPLSHRLLKPSVQFDKPVMRADWTLTPLYAAPVAAPVAQPLHITVLVDWLTARYRAAGGKSGITDVSAWAEEVMRWTEAQHGIATKEQDNG